jgi:hypothetical protein
MTHKVPTPWLLIAVSLLIALVGMPGVSLAGKGGGTSPPKSPTTFCGQATVVRATVLGIGTTISDTGPLPSAGGALEKSLLQASVTNLLTADILHATTIAQGNESRSEASVADVNLDLGLPLGGVLSVDADVLLARAAAVCGPGGASISGSSAIVGLVINGQAITVTGAPNQTVNVLVGTVIINEQTSNGPGDLTVNALHIIVPGVADVVLASAHADITCGANPGCPVGKDFVTGGGFTTRSGAKDTFGVAGGIKNGALWGHLEYIDHGPNGPKVHGTGVTAYVVTGTTSRHIEGTAEVNGQAGFTYQVDVDDQGEPGRNDTLKIWLSNGYNPGTGLLEGGNIQLHKPQCK